MTDLRSPSSDEQRMAFNAMKPFADPERKLTSQQERFVFLLMQGMSPRQSLRGAGYSENTSAVDVAKHPQVVRAIEYFQRVGGEQISVNRDKLTVMLFDAHSKAATATEEITAVRELGKMYGLYESDRQAALKGSTNVQINVNRLEALDDSELMKIAGIDSLEPMPEALPLDKVDEAYGDPPEQGSRS